VVLEHDRPVGSGGVDRLTIEDHSAGGDRNQARDHVQQGGLAAAGVADDRDELALVDLQVDALQHFGVAARRRR
jgi:hypothetical protein